MSFGTYAQFQAAIADHLARSDLTAQIADCTTLFEAEASEELFRLEGAEKTTILVPGMPSAIVVNTYANNGSGLVRLGLTSNATLTTGGEVSVSGVGTDANGSWIVTVIGDGISIDLQSSTYAGNTYSGGGQVQAPQGQVALPSDYLGWRRVTWTGSPTSDLQYVHPDIFAVEFPTFLPITDVDLPRVFTIEGSTLKIMPVDGTPLEFDYYTKTTAILTALNWLFTTRVDCYWNGVLQECYTYIKDYDQAGVFEAKKKACYDSIRQQSFKRPGALAIRPWGASYGACP